MKGLPPTLGRSIIWDQGTEMARHLATADKLGAPVYFSDSRLPGNAKPTGTKRTAARLLSKSVSLATHAASHLPAVEHELNHRPRVALQDDCPADLFATLPPAGVATMTRNRIGADRTETSLKSRSTSAAT